MVKFGVPHAIVIGNHDVEANLNADEILLLDSKIPSSYTLKGIVNNRDYIVPVYADESQTNVSFFMVFLDSGSYICEGVLGIRQYSQDNI